MEAPRESTIKRLQAGYGQLFERYPMPMLVVNVATLQLLAANEAAAQCYGYPLQQLTAMHLPDIYFEEDHKALPAYMALDLRERFCRRRWRHRGLNGRNIEVEMDARDMQLHGMPTRMLLVDDVTLAAMSQEKVLVKRIAQALHDQLGQTMAAMRIIHDTMGVLRKGKESREYLRLDQQLGRLIDQATGQLRKVLVDLHPPLLDEHGLAAALDNELHGRALNQPSVHFVLNVPPEVQGLRWPPATEYAALMIAREAVENAVRHAQATLITVNLAGDRERLQLDITDNGLGISAKLPDRAGHLGITGMGERAHSIAGSLSVGPAGPAGTCVRLLWPSNS